MRLTPSTQTAPPYESSLPCTNSSHASKQSPRTRAAPLYTSRSPIIKQPPGPDRPPGAPGTAPATPAQLGLPPSAFPGPRGGPSGSGPRQSRLDPRGHPPTPHPVPLTDVSVRPPRPSPAPAGARDGGTDGRELSARGTAALPALLRGRAGDPGGCRHLPTPPGRPRSPARGLGEGRGQAAGPEPETPLHSPSGLWVCVGGAAAGGRGAGPQEGAGPRQSRRRVPAVLLAPGMESPTGTESARLVSPRGGRADGSLRLKRYRRHRHPIAPAPPSPAPHRPGTLSTSITASPSPRHPHHPWHPWHRHPRHPIAPC